MEKIDKIIVLFYVVLALSYSLYVYETNNSTSSIELPDIIPKPVTDIQIVKVVDINREKIFRVMTDVSNYPLILPRNVISVDIIEEGKNFTIAKETVIEKGIKTTLLTRHNYVPYQKHVIEVLDGDAQGTKIIQNFTEHYNGTSITTTINIKLKGILTPLSFLPPSNLKNAADTILTHFVDYAETSEDKYKKIVDDVYREILLRPADPEGLNYYSKLLRENKLTKNDLQEILLNSEEKKSLIESGNLLDISDMSDDTQKIINLLYLEYLNRPADPEGLQYYGTLLETGRLSENELREIIFNSEEALRVRLHDDPIRKKIDFIYFEIFDQHANSTILSKYSSMIIQNETTFEDIKNKFASQKLSEN